MAYHTDKIRIFYISPNDHEIYRIVWNLTENWITAWGYFDDMYVNEKIYKNVSYFRKKSIAKGIIKAMAKAKIQHLKYLNKMTNTIDKNEVLFDTVYQELIKTQRIIADNDKGWDMMDNFKKNAKDMPK